MLLKRPSTGILLQPKDFNRIYTFGSGTSLRANRNFGTRTFGALPRGPYRRVVLVVIAAQADGPGIRRIRMRAIDDASAGSLHPFVQDYIEPGSTIHSDGWQGDVGLEEKGYQREITVLRGRRKEASQLMPRVHRVASLLKRWLLGTHQGAVEHEHLPCYLDEFTFRFIRRKSKSRGKLFFRLMQQAVSTPPATYDTIVKRSKPATQHVGSSGRRSATSTPVWGRSMPFRTGCRKRRRRC
ncbi:MAG TPA: IS1595 family transposase, partial [Methylococcaceae bacterium]|nr:IS1595 family transposase [Methylococcaceae bacterium]